MLKLENVCCGYGQREVLKSLSIKVGVSEIVTIIGANGAGKTTTLMTISGLLKVRSGKIIFSSREINNRPPQRIVEQGIIQVPEGRHIFPYLTVLENLQMGAFLQKDTKAIEQDLTYVFSLFPILSERRKQAGGTLSGGEQQMLAIARGLMAHPKLLLLDEPSLGLAPKFVDLIFEVILKINHEGTPILLVEQNAQRALSIASRGYVIELGKVVLEGAASDLLQNQLVKQAYLGN
ncbi:MAG: ABC transporter ATP-binding protein [Candidatus Stahlbacteria bacterium]|nr:ABC transporter ATP-binding protein [Candidatus Stahlbacteria bacterium]